MTRFLSAEFEPVRRYIYGVAIAIVLLGVAFGFVTADASVAITAVLAAALIVPAGEAARSKVRPETALDSTHEDADNDTAYRDGRHAAA